MVTLLAHVKNLSTNMNIVTGGCSFTRQYKRIGLNGTDSDFMEDSLEMWRWPHHIKSLYSDYSVFNLGNPTHDNTCIAHSVIKKSTELLSSGVSPNDIKIIIQWSDQDRDSYFLSKEVCSEYECSVIPPDNSLKDMYDDKWSHLSTFAEKNHFENRWGYYLLNGGFVWDHIKYPTDILSINAKYISPEQSLIRLCTNYLLVQNFCQVNGIDWTSFSLSYNFYDSNSVETQISNQNHGKAKSIYLDKDISKMNMDFNTNNPYIKYLIDNIDLTKNYFYKNEDTNIGGINEWAVKNFDLETDKEIFMEHNLLRDYENFEEFYQKNPNCGMGHVSQQMNKKFVEQILKTFLEKDLE